MHSWLFSSHPSSLCLCSAVNCSKKPSLTAWSKAVTSALSIALNCFWVFFFSSTVLNISCYHIRASFICLFNVGCQGSWMTLMWPQQTENIKRQKESLEPLVYSSGLPTSKADNPKKATEQAWRIFSKFGEPHGAAFWQWGSQSGLANTKPCDPRQSAPPP